MNDATFGRDPAARERLTYAALAIGDAVERIREEVTQPDGSLGPDWRWPDGDGIARGLLEFADAYEEDAIGMVEGDLLADASLRVTDNLLTELESTGISYRLCP